MAYDRLDYAQNFPEYLAHIQELRDNHADIWTDFEQGMFSVKTNKIAFTAIGIDHAQEHINKIHKGEGGLTSITTNPEAFFNFCLSAPVLTQI